jgi:glycerophosphoryl diester phosphodiesterase
MCILENIKHGIYKFNTLTTTQTYQIVYYSLAFVIFICSYLIQTIFDKPCNNIIAVFIRLFHHFIIYFIYFGFLAPANMLYVIGCVVFIANVSWIYFKNRCLLTILENKLCGYSSSRRLRDMIYYISVKLDRFVTRIRIYLVGIMVAIIATRLYIYYRTTRVVIQGHRGARGNRPENTIDAFDFALNNGIRTLEMDLHMTKDGVIVLYHDPIINKPFCDLPNTSANHSGKIKEMTLQQIKEYNCGVLKNPDFPDQVSVSSQIPTFLELIAHIKNNYPFLKVRMNVEIKTTKEDDTDEYVKLFADRLVYILKEHGMIDSTIIQSFDVRGLKHIRNLNPNIQTSYITEEEDEVEAAFDVCIQNGFNIVSPHYSSINKEIVDKFHKASIKVIPWNINKTSDLRRMLEIEVDEIITDYPVLFQEYLSTS